MSEITGFFREGVPFYELMEVEGYREPVCICGHEPHDGVCPELVRVKCDSPPGCDDVCGSLMECGCDDYTPNREVVGTES